MCFLCREFRGNWEDSGNLIFASIYLPQDCACAEPEPVIIFKSHLEKWFFWLSGVLLNISFDVLMDFQSTRFQKEANVYSCSES